MNYKLLNGLKKNYSVIKFSVSFIRITSKFFLRKTQDTRFRQFVKNNSQDTLCGFFEFAKHLFLFDNSFLYFLFEAFLKYKITA